MLKLKGDLFQCVTYWGFDEEFTWRWPEWGGERTDSAYLYRDRELMLVHKNMRSHYTGRRWQRWMT